MATPFHATTGKKQILFEDDKKKSNDQSKGEVQLKLRLLF